MNKLSPTRSLTRFLALFTGLYAMVLSPSAMAGQRALADFDKTAVTDIEFRIAEDNLDQFGFALPTAAMTARVIDNLAGWHYPIRTASAQPYSHTLQAHIGPITHQKTPVGFSFSSGNSDPRAPDFQKADVITITCDLTANKDPLQSVGHTLDFSAGPIVDAAKNHADQAKAVNLLVDHLSTACFNLLEDLELEEKGHPGQGRVTKPGWMPEIRVEINEEPNAGSNAGAGKGGEGRKQITIHNQGTPVILKLGHERL